MEKFIVSGLRAYGQVLLQVYPKGSGWEAGEEKRDKENCHGHGWHAFHYSQCCVYVTML